MSELGQPKEPAWTEEDDDYIREHSYMTVKELAQNLNRTEPAIRNRKYKLGIKRGNCKPFTDQELEQIKDWYTRENGVDLDGLSKLLNRPKTSISAIARTLGLTKYGNFTASEKEIRKENMREMVLTIEHPRGMLGKHHTKEVCEKMSKFQLQRAINMTYEEKHEIAMKAVQTKRKNGTLNQTTSNAYSRTKSGKRKDLNDQFFRSAWEANVARILNYLKIDWKYECKRFIFDENDTGIDSYQPDFYLPELDKWIEVKGWMDNKSKIRLKFFEQQYPEEYKKLILIDQNFYNLLRRTYFNLDNWEDSTKSVRFYKNNYFERLDEKQKHFIENIFMIKNEEHTN